MKARTPVVLLALAVCLTLPGLADVLVLKKGSTEAIGTPDAQPEQSTSTTWIGDGKLAEVADGRRTVIDLGLKKVYVIEDATKTFSVIDLPIDFKKLAPGMDEMIEQFMSQMQLQVTVTPAEERKEINGFAAQRYDLKVSSAMGLSTDMTLWVTKAIDIDMEQWRAMSREMGSLAPPGVGELFRKMTEIDGFPVLQETTMSMMGNTMRSREEVVSVERKAAPEGIYAPPTDYTEKPFDPLGAAQQ